jgi:hypothetical protein
MGLGMVSLCLAAISSAAEVELGEMASAVVAVLAIASALAAANRCTSVQQAKHEEPSSAGSHPQNENYHFPFSLAAVVDVP